MDNISSKDSNLSDFQPAVVEKVTRLLDLLEEIQRHPDLKNKLGMYGGTAINLFMFNLPRLSVDIDLSYVGAIERNVMIKERPLIEHAIEEVIATLGYASTGTQGDHAGRTFVLNYRGQWGSDHIKIDLTYLNRSPLLPIQKYASPLRSSLKVPMFVEHELIGGKVKALFDRAKVHDLYDIGNIYQRLKTETSRDTDEQSLAHQVILYYASISACFPYDFQNRASKKFANREQELKEQLYPMLRSFEVEPQLDLLINQADCFIEDFVLPQNENEHFYLKRFAEGYFEPSLLFDNDEIAQAAQQSPAAQWKLLNLKRIKKK